MQPGEIPLGMAWFLAMRIENLVRNLAVAGALAATYKEGFNAALEWGEVVEAKTIRRSHVWG